MLIIHDLGRDAGLSGDSKDDKFAPHQRDFMTAMNGCAAHGDVEGRVKEGVALLADKKV